jgi:hypothetical protein
VYHGPEPQGAATAFADSSPGFPVSGKATDMRHYTVAFSNQAQAFPNTQT